MPEKIGPYSVVSQLGRGGMGVVYKGRDERLNRFVAIKVLTENLSEDPTFLQRFVREAQAAAALSHPNVVQIYFTGQDDDGHPYFVMEYVAGQSLDHVLRSEGRIDNPRASQLMLQAAHGLAAAHDLGIIHRDIKPANLILDERGIVKIADFGLALPADAETRLTATGMFVGTPGYLSPEQCAGEIADHRTDIYALGITYYMLLTGTPPFRGQSPLALMKQILDANPPDVTTINPNIDPESRRILAKMIAKDRQNRYQNCHELVADLENLLASMGVRSMTAGLGTRATASNPGTAAAMAAPAPGTAPAMPVPAPGTAAAMSAPTMVVSGSGANAPLSQAAAVTEASPLPQAAPLPRVADVTSPESPLPSTPTMPSMQQPPMQPPPMQPPPIKKGASSPMILVAALVAFVLLAGGAFAAVWYGTSLFRGDSQTDAKQAIAASPSKAPQPAEANAIGASPATNPQEALLSQPLTPANSMASQSAPPNAPQSGSPAASPTASQNATRIASAPAAVSSPAVTQPRTQVAAQQQSTPSTMPAPAQQRRGLSGVAVAAYGDQAVLGAVSSVLRAQAEAAGLDVTDANALPATEDLFQGRVALRDLIAELRHQGFATLMVAKIEATGERELSYYGRVDTAYTSRITVTAYDLASGRPFGTPQTGSMTYTSISIDSESEDVVTPLAKAVAQTIRNH